MSQPQSAGLSPVSRDTLSNHCENRRTCGCTFDCPNHGKCCACVAHHREHREGPPACFLSGEAEALYYRDMENLAREKGIIK